MDISIKFEDISPVKKRLKVEVPVEIALKKLDQVANDYRKHARLSGFRPGKAPVALVKSHFRTNIRDDVIQKLVPESYNEAIKQQGVEPLSDPTLENLTFEEGQPLVYEANFEISPEIKLPKYKGLKISVELNPVTDEDVEKELERLRDQHSQLLAVEDRSVEKDDYVVVDLHGEYLDITEEEKEQDPIEDENVVVQVGHGHTHEAFSQALMGMSMEQTKEFEVDYADDYPEEKLAGHKVCFNIKVNEIKSKQLPELNDEFAKDLGEFDTMEQLYTKIREGLAEQREESREGELRSQLISQLVEGTPFEVPETLVENRIDSILQDMAHRMSHQGIDPMKANMDWSKIRSDLRPEAEKQVRGHLILGEIAIQEEVEALSDELDVEIEKMADSMGQPVEKVRQYFQQEQHVEGLKEQIIQQKTLDNLMQSAKVK